MAIAYDRSPSSSYALIDYPPSFPSNESSHECHSRLSKSPLITPSDYSWEFVNVNSPISEFESTSPLAGSPDSRRHSDLQDWESRPIGTISERPNIAISTEGRGSRASPIFNTIRPIYQASPPPSASCSIPAWSQDASLAGLNASTFDTASVFLEMAFTGASTAATFAPTLTAPHEPWTALTSRNTGPPRTNMTYYDSSASYDPFPAWQDECAFVTSDVPAQQPALMTGPELQPSVMASRQLSNASSYSTNSMGQNLMPEPISFAQQNMPSQQYIPPRANLSQNLLSTTSIAQHSTESMLSPIPDSALCDVKIKPQPTPSPVPGKRKLDQLDSQSTDRVFVQCTPGDGKETHAGSGAPHRRPAKGRHGGRQHGTHLQGDVAARARQIREIGTCWLCCLQRDSCSPGEVCQRCIKRNQRANMEHGYTLGCDRTRLVSLKTVFIPEWYSQKHSHQSMLSLAQDQIRRVTGAGVPVELLCIFGLPSIPCELYEFEPKDQSALKQVRYFQNPETNVFEPIWSDVLPLAFLQLDREDSRKYDEYVTTIVDNHLEKFAHRYYYDEDDDFLPRLLKLMIQLKPAQREEVALLRDVYRLLVITHIMGRLKFFPKTYHPYFAQKLRFYDSQAKYGSYPGSNIVNSQLNCLFLANFNATMETVLRKLNQVLRSSKGNAKWTSAFCALLGLAMCVEDIQNSVHVYCNVQAFRNLFTKDEARSRRESSCKDIDDRFTFLTNLFRLKYSKFNPLRDWKKDAVWNDMNPSAREFAKGVSELVVEKFDSFLYARQHISVAEDDAQKYFARLISRFLCSFWGPSSS